MGGLVVAAGFALLMGGFVWSSIPKEMVRPIEGFGMIVAAVCMVAVWIDVEMEKRRLASRRANSVQGLCGPYPVRNQVMLGERPARGPFRWFHAPVHDDDAVPYRVEAARLLSARTGPGGMKDGDVMFAAVAPLGEDYQVIDRRHAYWDRLHAKGFRSRSAIVHDEDVPKLRAFVKRLMDARAPASIDAQHTDGSNGGYGPAAESVPAGACAEDTAKAGGPPYSNTGVAPSHPSVTPLFATEGKV